MPPIGPVMECPKCGHANPAGSYLCASCSAPISEETVMMTELTSQDRSSPVPSGPAAGGEELEPGTVLGDRYEILEMLGVGGMGAVYKAKDRELDRLVALKVIRPDLANNPSIIERFKQELILARQVTHKNVIRVFDLGVAGSIKFITMEFIEGRTLAAVMSERRFTPEESTRTIQQMCRALEAAHAEGVVHRDLKPQNVMVDAQGKASVMDFGLALSSGVPGAPKAGGLGGTPAYMSPEQVTSAEVDHRSDIFTLGVIYHELLLGQLPFQADSVLKSLRMRTEEPARPVTEADPTIPKAISDIVQKCMAIDPAARFQSASELLHELDIVTGDYKPVTPFWKWTAAAAGVLLVTVVVVGIFFGNRIFKPPPPKKVVTVLVADFRNTTGEPVFDRTLEPMVTLALEGASFITSMRRDQALRIGRQLQPGATALDESLARLVAMREGLNVVVAGSIGRQGGGYELSVRAIDTVKGEAIATRRSEASSQQDVLGSVARLAAPIRRALGDTTPEAAQVAAAETYTAASLEAAHTYALAQERMWAGELPEAIQMYTKAVELDPNMGRAWAGLAVASANLKRYTEAGDYYKKALALLDRVSERERFRTLGTYYISYARNYPQAIDTLRKLVSLYPADTAGYNNLSVAYAYVRNLPEAQAASRRALEISPNNVQNRLNFAVYSLLAGAFDGAAAEAERILKQNPKYEFAYLPLALSTLARGDVAGARAVYTRLADLSPHGLSLAKAGEADLEMYLGRYRVALVALQAGLQADEKEKNAGEMAVKYVAVAEAQLALGERRAAAASALRATQLSDVESVLYPAGMVLLQAGQEGQARAVATRLENTLQSQLKSYARLIGGEIALQHGRTSEAVDQFQEALKLLDSWMARFLTGRAYVEAGHFAEALGHLENCQKRSGEAADLFFADTTTLRYLPPLYYWLGRAQEGLGSGQAALENYQRFLKLRSEAPPGAPLVEDARRRSGG